MNTATRETQDNYIVECFDAANPQHLSLSTALMERIWGEVDFASEPYMRWQYVNNPLGPAVADLVFDRASGDLAAQYFTIPSALHIPAKGEVPALLSVNTATSPQHQRRGLFKRSALSTFSRAGDLGYESVYGFPNDASLPGFQKMKFDKCETLSLYFSVFNPLTFLTGAGTLVRNWGFPQFVEAPSSLSQMSEDVFYPESSSREQFLHVPRTQKWCQWRYVDHPTRKYLSWRGEKSSIVLRVFQLGKIRIAIIFDVFGDFDAESASQFKKALRRDSIHGACGVFSPSYFKCYPHLQKALAWRMPQAFSPKSFHTIYLGLQGSATPQASQLFTLGDIDLY
jgi:hypothetical protein